MTTEEIENLSPGDEILSNPVSRLYTVGSINPAGIICSYTTETGVIVPDISFSKETLLDDWLELIIKPLSITDLINKCYSLLLKL